MDTLIFQNIEWATDLVNEVYSRDPDNALMMVSVAVAELAEQDITDRANVAAILKRSMFAEGGRTRYRFEHFHDLEGNENVPEARE